MSSLNQTKQLEQFILKTVQKQNNKEAFNDTVYTGTIEGSEAGYYNVKLTNGNSINVVKGFPLNDQQNFNIEDYVYLLSAPIKIGDNNGTKYFIIGLVEDYQEDFFNLSDLERFTILEESRVSLEEISSNDEEEVEITNAILLESIKSLEAFKIKGVFSCDMDNVNSSDFYTYKINFYLNNEENIVEETPSVSYSFGSQDFIGQPFNIKEMLQEKVFHFNSLKTIGKIGIALNKSNENIIFSVEDFSIEAGSIAVNSEEFSVKIKTQNNKNYFYSIDSENDIVSLTADVYYRNQLLSTSNLQYYWIVDKNNLKNEYISDDRKLHFIDEENWYCINDYIEEQILGREEKIQIWKTKENDARIIKIEKGTIFTSYENKIKCYIKYGNVLVKSEKLIILDFSKENFETSIEANTDPLILFRKTDQIVLTSLIENKNVNDKHTYTYHYCWFKEDGGSWLPLNSKKEDDILIPVYEKNTETKDWSKLIIVGEKPEEENINYYLLKDLKIEKFKCNILVKLDDTQVSIEESNEISISSKITDQVIETLVSYKYYISSNESVLFEKEKESHLDYIKTNDIEKKEDKTYYIKQEDDSFEEFNGSTFEQDTVYYEQIENFFWAGDWTIIDNKETEPKWSEDEITSLNTLINLPLANGKYLYYTSKTSWKENQEILKEENWLEPKMLRGISSIGEEFSEEVINKFNAFNNLTGGGQDQGLYIDEATKNVYINAEYIKTGALLVGENSNPTFKADIALEQVEIGGYLVYNTELKSNNGTVGISSDDSAETNIAFWAGSKNKNDAPFKVNYAGNLISTSADIKGVLRATELYIGNGEGETTNIINADKNALEFNSNNLIINSDNLKYNLEGDGSLEIDGSVITKGTLDASSIISGSITSTQIATDAIKSKEYKGVLDASDFSETGSFLDLNTGYFTTPNLLLNANGLKIQGDFIGGNIELASDNNAIKIVIGSNHTGLKIITQDNNKDLMLLNSQGFTIYSKTNENLSGGIFSNDKYGMILYSHDKLYPTLGGLLEDQWKIGSSASSKNRHNIPGIRSIILKTSIGDNQTIVIGRKAVYLCTLTVPKDQINFSEIKEITSDIEYGDKETFSGHGFNYIYGVCANKRIIGIIGSEKNSVECGDLHIGVRWVGDNVTLTNRNDESETEIEGPVVWIAADYGTAVNGGLVINIFGIDATYAV